MEIREYIVKIPKNIKREFILYEYEEITVYVKTSFLFDVIPVHKKKIVISKNYKNSFSKPKRTSIEIEMQELIMKNGRYRSCWYKVITDMNLIN